METADKAVPLALPFGDPPFEATSKYPAAKTDIIQPALDL